MLSHDACGEFCHPTAAIRVESFFVSKLVTKVTFRIKYHKYLIYNNNIDIFHNIYTVPLQNHLDRFDRGSYVRGHRVGMETS